MANPRHLNHAPITEALIDIHVEQRDGLSFGALQDAFSTLDFGYDEQKPVKTTAFDLQIEPASPGLSFNTERILLYVACTRARAFLLVTGVAPASEVLDDLQKAASSNS